MKLYESANVPGYRFEVEAAIGHPSIAVRLKRRHGLIFWTTVGSEVIRTADGRQPRALREIDRDVDSAKCRLLERAATVEHAHMVVDSRRCQGIGGTL